MISAKVYLPVLVAIAAAVMLWRLTGDDTYLVTILIGLVGGGVGAVAKPAPGVTQAEVRQLSEQKKK